jgi:capsular polysaccharide biosynthesis protein
MISALLPGCRCGRATPSLRNAQAATEAPSTGRGSTYRNRNGVSTKPATSPQHFDELLFPYPLVENGDFWLRPPSVKDFYANLPVPAGPQHKRIYVTREDAGMRRLVNEAAVLELTQRHGFVAVEVGKLTFTEQLALFRGADLVMGVHGAGLAHVVSMSPSAGVLEILHPRRFWPTYRALSARCNLIYAFAVGEDPGPSMSGDSFDFNIDLSKLERVLSVLIHKHKEVQTNGTP